MGEVYLLRHGQTEWSADGRHTGRTDIGLTAEGEHQAAAVRGVLARLRGEAPARVLTSPRTRARRTAELAGLTVDETTEELSEWDYGDYEGITTPEIRRTVPDWTVWSHPIPGGESARAVGERADRVLIKVRSLLPDTDVILVGHGHFSRVLIARWLGLPVSAGVGFAVEPAALSLLGHERESPQIRHLNVPSGSLSE